MAGRDRRWVPLRGLVQQVEPLAAPGQAAVVGTQHAREAGVLGELDQHAAGSAPHVEHGTTGGRQDGAGDPGGGRVAIERVVDDESTGVVEPRRLGRLFEDLLRKAPALEQFGPARSRRQTSSPSIPGSIKSSTTRSGGLSLANPSPICPSVAISTR